MHAVTEVVLNDSNLLQIKPTPWHSAAFLRITEFCGATRNSVGGENNRT